MQPAPSSPIARVTASAPQGGSDHLRYQRAHAHLARPFGTDRFALAAETFARWFGTPLFLGAQTLVVAMWITAHVAGWVRYDPYPFILLNLAFSL